MEIEMEATHGNGATETDIPALAGSPTSRSPPPPPPPPPEASSGSSLSLCPRLLCPCFSSGSDVAGCGIPNRIRPQNRVLPVTFASPSNQTEDFLEIRPQRRIRVVHAIATETNGTARRRRRKKKRAATQSRATSRTEDESSSDDEEYWFENAAPKRLPIEQPPPKKRGEGHNRIFNKFEPQQTPRIPGINPPSARTRGGGGDCNMANGSANVPEISPVAGQRLQRKVIIPDAIMDDLDDEDDEHLVSESPIDDVGQPGEDEPAEDLVANALNDMSGMLLNITADSTEKRGASAAAASPEPDTKHVLDEPFPSSENREEDGEGETSKVVVSGGHLGGMANVAFEEEEEGDAGVGGGSFDAPPPADHESPHTKDDGDGGSGAQSEHEADAGYRRERDMLKAVLSIEDQFRREQESQHREPQLPVLFFLHGVGGSATIWTSQISYFTARGYEVVVPDLLGHGFSSVPDDPKSYTFNKLFRDVLTIFDHYVYEGRPCAIIAHSYGCSFAAALSRARPSSVTMLLLLASGGPIPLAPPAGLKAMPAFVIGCMKPFLRCSFFRRNNYMVAGPPSGRGRSIKFPEALDVPGYVLKHIMNGQHWPEGDASFHRRISIPTLLIYGLKDPLVSLVEMCEMERTIPKSYLELVPLAGHMIMLEQPKELNLMMRRFIEKYLEKATLAAS